MKTKVIHMDERADGGDKCNKGCKRSCNAGIIIKGKERFIRKGFVCPGFKKDR